MSLVFPSRLRSLPSPGPFRSMGTMEAEQQARQVISHAHRLLRPGLVADAVVGPDIAPRTAAGTRRAARVAGAVGAVAVGADVVVAVVRELGALGVAEAIRLRVGSAARGSARWAAA